MIGIYIDTQQVHNTHINYWSVTLLVFSTSKLNILCNIFGCSQIKKKNIAYNFLSVCNGALITTEMDSMFHVDTVW